MRTSARALLLLLSALLLGLAPVAVRGAEPDEDDPHAKMVRSRAVCIDCHTRVPKDGEHAPDYFLVDTPSESCLGCHGQYEHAGVREHAGQDAAPLPGDEHGKIACFTCHDPHPAGVIPGRRVHESDVAPRTRSLMAARELPPSVERREPKAAFGGLLRFSTTNDEGCAICHASRDDTASWRARLTWGELIRVLPHY